MPLRKKHVRRIVLVLLFAFVLGPLLGLTLYGLWVRRGGYEGQIETELETRLRCKARVRGARPTGFKTAAADEVDLIWRAGGGQLAIRLDGVDAEANRFGWYINAANGAVSLDGPNPAETLAALNQRLVQVDGEARLMMVRVASLDVALDLGPATVAGTCFAVASSDADSTWVVNFRPKDFMVGPARALEADVKPFAVLTLNAASDGGVFGGLKVDVKDVQIASILRPPSRGANGGSDGKAAGVLDLAINWRRPETAPHTGRRAETVAVAARVHDLDLADWTRGMPGGPVTGKAELAVEYSKSRGAAGQLVISLVSEEGGQVSGETLRWLQERSAGFGGAGRLLPGRIGYDHLAVRYRIVGGRVWVEGKLAAPAVSLFGQADGAVPILTTRLFGADVPLLWASPEVVDASDLWSVVCEAAGAGP